MERIEKMARVDKRIAKKKEKESRTIVNMKGSQREMSRTKKSLI